MRPSTRTRPSRSASLPRQLRRRCTGERAERAVAAEKANASGSVLRSSSAASATPSAACRRALRPSASRLPERGGWLTTHGRVARNTAWDREWRGVALPWSCAVGTAGGGSLRGACAHPTPTCARSIRKPWRKLVSLSADLGNCHSHAPRPGRRRLSHSLRSLHPRRITPPRRVGQGEGRYRGRLEREERKSVSSHMSAVCACAPRRPPSCPASYLGSGAHLCEACFSGSRSHQGRCLSFAAGRSASEAPREAFAAGLASLAVFVSCITVARAFTASGGGSTVARLRSATARPVKLIAALWGKRGEDSHQTSATRVSHVMG